MLETGTILVLRDVLPFRGVGKPAGVEISEKREMLDKSLTLLFSLLFSISLLFSFSDFPCFFGTFFLSFPRILGVPQDVFPFRGVGLPQIGV